MNPSEPQDQQQQPEQPPKATEFLVREVVHGEKTQAWVALSPKILDYLRTRFGNSAFPPGVEFADFVSETMLKILTSIQTFEYRGKDSFWKWVQTLAGNHWRDLWRRFDRDRRLGLRGRGEHDGGDADERPPSLTEAAPSAEASPTSIVRCRELEAAEAECASKLPKQQREVYMLRRQSELSFAEIAEKTGGQKEVTLRSHYMRARDSVRECLSRKIDELGSRIDGWQ